jgi:hypothetical protein
MHAMTVKRHGTTILKSLAFKHLYIDELSGAA